MHIVITGGSGFLGARLARTLLAQGSLVLHGAPARAISRLTLSDLAPAPADLLADKRVHSVVGDLSALLQNGALLDHSVALVFHLAAAVSAECEADFDLGMRSNLAATQALLQACRALDTAPALVFASSMAVFGQAPGDPLPAQIQDHTLPTPQTSYGIQKFIGEQLVADFSRKGFIRGRSVRLMTVSVRPGRPNGAASGFLSSIIREPLAGQRAICPVPPDTQVALASPACAIAGLLCAASVEDAAWGSCSALNLPTLSLSVREMVQALERVAGAKASALIDWQLDEGITHIVQNWASAFHSERAQRLGLTADESFEAVIRNYQRDYM